MLGALAIELGCMRHRFELRQRQPSLVSAVEELEARERSLPELLDGDRAVEVSVRGRDRFGYVEQRVSRCALKGSPNPQARIDLGCAVALALARTAAVG